MLQPTMHISSEAISCFQYPEWFWIALYGLSIVSKEKLKTYPICMYLKHPPKTIVSYTFTFYSCHSLGGAVLRRFWDKWWHFKHVPALSRAFQATQTPQAPATSLHTQHIQRRALNFNFRPRTIPLCAGHAPANSPMLPLGPKYTQTLTHGRRSGHGGSWL